MVEINTKTGEEKMTHELTFIMLLLFGAFTLAGMFLMWSISHAGKSTEYPYCDMQCEACDNRECSQRYGYDE